MPARSPTACAAISCRSATWHRPRFGTDGGHYVTATSWCADGADEESDLGSADGNRSELQQAAAAQKCTTSVSLLSTNEEVKGEYPAAAAA